MPVVQPAVVTRSAAAAAGTPEAIQDYLNDQVAVFKDRIEKKTEENIARMIKDNNVILQDSFDAMSTRSDQAMKNLKDSVDDSIQSFRTVFETKRLAMEVDMKDIKSRVKQLPLSGDINKLFVEKAANESVIASSQFRSDDSMDISFQNRTSAAAAFEEVSFEEKNKERAGCPLKNSVSKFKGPVDNENWINVREDSLTGVERSLLDEFEFIGDREKVLVVLRPGREDRPLSTEDERRFKNDMFNKGQKWDSDFARDTKDWDGKSCYDGWFSKFWRVAKNNYISNPMLFKDTLYDRIYDSRGKDLGELITPVRNKSSSALKYYLQIRRLVVPVTDPEMASSFFYNLKQTQNQTVDYFFKQKLKMFRVMCPGEISKRQWRDFYFSVSKTLLYSQLATDMAQYVDTMTYIEDYSSYLNHLLKRGQYYVNWANSGHTSTENITACYSDAMELLFAGNQSERAEFRKQKLPTINEIQSVYSGAVAKQNLAQTDAGQTRNDYNDWSEVDHDGSKQALFDNMVAVVNPTAKGYRCWHCNKQGHMMTECFMRRDGKPPTPDSKFGKDNSKGGDKSVPNNRVLPDQFVRSAPTAATAINQVDAEAASQQEAEIIGDQLQEKQWQEILQEAWNKGQAKAPL